MYQHPASQPMPPTGKNLLEATEGEITKVPTGVTLRALLAGEQMVMVEAFWPKGTLGTLHDHADHESMGYLVRGRMRISVGDESFIAEPGATWIQPAGVIHRSEALEDSVHIEVKSPPRKTW